MKSKSSGNLNFAHKFNVVQIFIAIIVPCILYQQ